MTEHDKFVNTVVRNAAFRAFVEDVSPRSTGQAQPVFFAEAFLILQILWEIFQFLKKMGWFKKWIETGKIRRAMKAPTLLQREKNLQVILAYYKAR